MEYLPDNARILFTLLLLISVACLISLMALVYWIIDKIKAARTLAGLPAAACNPASPQACRLRAGCNCQPDGARLGGACSCR